VASEHLPVTLDFDFVFEFEVPLPQLLPFERFTLNYLLDKQWQCKQGLGCLKDAL
jgi:hypothetical protein